MERVKTACRCGECIVGNKVKNDGAPMLYCSTNLIYTRHEDFCSQGRKRVVSVSVSVDETEAPEEYHRCKKCTAILNFMGDRVAYCADCGQKVDWGEG